MNYLFISIIFFFAGIEAELLGFGISTISMSLLPYVLPLSSVIPLVAVISVIATGVIAYRTKTKDLSKYLKPLWIGSIVGIPLGLVFLRFIGEKPLSITLGLLLIFSAFYHLTIHKKDSFINKISGSLIGFIAGFFGAAINVNGPLLALFPPKGVNSKMKKKDIITTYMFFTGIFVIIGHILAGNIKSKIFTYLIYSIPSLFLGILIGEKIDKKINRKTLRVLIGIFVIGSGIKLLLFK